MHSLKLNNVRLEGAHAKVFVKPLKEVLAGRKIGIGNSSKSMLEESLLAMNAELFLIRKLFDGQQKSLDDAVSLNAVSFDEMIPCNTDYSKMIAEFMIETPSFLGKKFGSKNVLEGDGDKVVVNHFHKVEKLLQIVSKMNKTIAEKIKIIEDNC